MNNTYYGKLIYELSQPGRQGYSLPENRCAEYKMSDLPKGLMRENAPLLPEVDELSVVRHYTNMSNNNFGVDTGFYPLGSCTMKYNPKSMRRLPLTASSRACTRCRTLRPPKVRWLCTISCRRALPRFLA